jgi:hypothetical protein
MVRSVEMINIEKSSSVSRAGKRRKLLSSIFFLAGLVAIFLFVLFLSRLERPPEMPSNGDHRSTDEWPNAYCMNCHTAASLPRQHPLEYEKFECTRCHGQKAADAR